MSNIFLSFASISKLHDNSKLSISPIGELSNKSRTYNKDPAVFTLEDETRTTLFNFFSGNEEEEISMPESFYTRQIEISDWLYEEGVRGNLNENVDTCLEALQLTFVNNIEILEIGEMVTDSTMFLPSMVHGKHIETVMEEDGITESTIEHEFYLWFSNEHFQREYPYIEFVIVHPVPLDEIDSLVELNYQELAARIAQETPDIIEQRTKDLSYDAKYPHTVRDVQPFDTFDIANEPNFNKLYWRYLSWGNNIDSTEKLFDQIQNEILENSKYPREEWELVIPDLFNPVEFMLIPYFNELGIKNLTNGTSQFSPVVKEDTRRLPVDHYLLDTYGEEHIIKSLDIVPFLYKSIKVGIVSKPSNREGYERFSKVFSDYQLIPSTDADFEDMSPLTRKFILIMSNLIEAANEVTPTSVVPTGISRIEKNGKLCVSTMVEAVKLIMVTRYQFVEDGLIEE